MKRTIGLITVGSVSLDEGQDEKATDVSVNNHLYLTDCDNVGGTDCINSFPFKKRGLKIVHLNIQHIFPKFDEIRVILRDISIDILAFTETFLNDTYDSKELNIIGYQLLRKDRLLKGGGGILVYIKQSLCVFERDEIKVDGVESL